LQQYFIPILNQNAIVVGDKAQRMPGASSASSIRRGVPASPPCRLDIIFDLENGIAKQSPPCTFLNFDLPSIKL
jgi:hypothetical protein